MFVSEWETITKDPITLSWVKGYTIPFTCKVHQNLPPPEPTWSRGEKESIFSEILRLLSIGAIRECSPCTGQFISKIFLVPKPSGGHRLILNLKNLNKFVHLQHFKLEDRRTACRLISKGCFMATVDLQEAYFLVSVNKKSRKYLRFHFKNTLYEFTCLPFGLASAPYVFTKLMKPVVSLLRENHLSVIYLDDMLLFGDSYNNCLENIKATKLALNKLGFKINYNKSQLSPTTSCKFLGFIFNSVEMSIKLPSEKQSRITRTLQRFCALNECRIRDFAKMLGVLISVCPAIKYGWVYTKRLERAKFLALQEFNSYDRTMLIPQYVKDDLKWWLKNVTSQNFISRKTFQLEIFSDASSTGWGAVCNNQRASGYWSQEERKHHINYLELLAALFGLKCFAANLKHAFVLLRVDNTTAISYINRMGGVQFCNLNQLAREIWQWCEARNIWVFASYIKSSDNTDADHESRRNDLETEYEISQDAFSKIVNLFGHPEIDLFASRTNKKCERFVSWRPDPESAAVDAFTLDWANIYFYAFPPFSMILPMLQKIVQDKACGIVVVPLWKTQPWYPLFIRLLISTPLTLNPQSNLLLSFDRSPHPLWTKLTLEAGIVSGKHSD